MKSKSRHTAIVFLHFFGGIIMVVSFLLVSPIEVSDIIVISAMLVSTVVESAPSAFFF